MIADWVAAEVDAGRTELQPMMDRAPYPAASVRTIAEDGDFELVDGHVTRRREPEFTWFPTELIDLGGAYGYDVIADRAVEVPRSVAALYAVPRMSRRSIPTDDGAVIVFLYNDKALLSPVRAEPGEKVRLFFEPDRLGLCPKDYGDVARYGPRRALRR